MLLSAFIAIFAVQNSAEKTGKKMRYERIYNNFRISGVNLP